MNESLETPQQSGPIDNVAAGSHSSRLSSLIFFLLCFVPIFTTLLFGGVDNATWIIVTICWVAIILMWLVEAWRAKGLIFAADPLPLPLTGLLLIGLIQLLPLGSGAGGDILNIPASRSLTLDPSGTRFFLSHLVVYIVFLAACLTFINSEKRLKKLVFLVVIFGSVLAFVAIIQRLASPESIYGLRAPLGAIPFGPFVNQHHFASLMLMTGGVTLSLILGKTAEQNRKPLLMIALAIMAIGTIMTGSRGGLIGFVSVAAFVLIVNFVIRKGSSRSSETEETQKLPRIVTIGASFAVAVLLILATVVFLGGDDSLVRGLSMNAAADDISSGRTHFWSVAIKIFFEHPILGAGLDAFGVAFTKHDTWHGIFRVEQAHNEYLQILAETGIVGFACIAVFIYLLFRKGLRTITNAGSGFRQTAAIGALAGCFGIFVHSFVDFPLRTPSNGFFFLLLVAIATVSVKAAGKGESHRRKKRRSTSHSQ
ncbi:MAG TPA: O-antigen ligase family protein [Pyrinomonadaceae bacterium]|nr:O-antigen ligase family protein [Pyrinomonadaceae bacterium]